MKVTCPNCQQSLDAMDLCPHRDPVGWCCCHEVHPFRPDDTEDDAA